MFLQYFLFVEQKRFWPALGSYAKTDKLSQGKRVPHNNSNNVGILWGMYPVFTTTCIHGSGEDDRGAHVFHKRRKGNETKH